MRATATATAGPHRRSDRGSASLAAVSCLGVLLLLGAALGVVAAIFTAHRTAQSAADLGALAGAAALAWLQHFVIFLQNTLAHHLGVFKLTLILKDHS